MSETVENKPHKARDPPSAGIVQPKGAVEGSCLTFAATFIVVLFDFYFAACGSSKVDALSSVLPASVKPVISIPEL